MSGDSQNLERSTLERKDRAELAAVAGALGLKVPSRAKKADIVTLILDVVAQPGGGDSDDAPAADAATATNGSAATNGSNGNGSHAAGADATGGESDEDGDDDAADAEPEPTSADGESDAADHDGSDQDGGDHDGADAGDGEHEGSSRSRRRRRRGRDRGDGEAGANGQPGESEGEPVEVAGLLDLRDDGYGFLRVAGFLPSRDDVYVSVKQCRQLGLRKGDHLTGLARPAGHKEKNPALTRVETVNGMDPEQARNRPRFDEFTAIAPDDQLTLAGGGGQNGDDRIAGLVDSLSPLAKGQRALVVAPPHSGRAEVLQSIARAVEANQPDVQLIVLLVDERPEDVSAFRQVVDSGEVVASTFDRPVEEHAAVAELTVEHAKRLVEYGYDVVILLDGLTRLARAYNTSANSGRTLPGGLDAGALHPTKRFFGAARNIEDGGSLTIIATIATETGSALDAAIFEELQYTANRELRLAGHEPDANLLDVFAG